VPTGVRGPPWPSCFEIMALQQSPNADMYSHCDNKGIEGKLPYASFKRELGDLQLEDLIKHKDIIDSLVQKFKENWDRGLGSESFFEDTFIRTQLRRCIFVGHVNTDVDSVAGAICAAELFGGTAARAEEKVNGEIEYALKYVGMQLPPTFDSLPAGGAPDADGFLKSVCLVDHNEVDQMTPALRSDPKRMKRIIGIIDHHAIAGSFTSSAPLFIDIRPWGCMCSIVFHMYIRNRVPIRKEIARLLLCAILSDTLNLRSGTTTPADRFSVAMLAAIGEVDDVNSLAMQLFSAKTSWIVGLGAYEMVRGDQKNFLEGDIRWSIAVLEVTSLEPVLAVADEIITQLRIFKYEKGDSTDSETGDKHHDTNKECHCALLFVVDTVRQCSVALVCGAREKELATRAFPGATWRAASEGINAPSEFVKPEETLCDVGGLVSRKLDFMPRCKDALSKDVPSWFTITSKEQQRLAKVIESGSTKPTYHDSVQMVWDKAMMKAAVFYTRADAALLMDILQEEED